MSQRFTSSAVNKVDGKGRVSVPAAFRRVLELQGADGCFYLVPGFRNRHAIEGYSPAGHEEIASKISRMHPADRARKKLEYLFLGRSIPMQVDETGRIVLSPALRAAAEIGEEALFIGAGDSFQIWNPDAHEAEMRALFEDDDADSDPLALMPWDGAE